MVPSTYHRLRRSLGRELKGIRESAGFSGNQFAKDLGWPQSKVSRIETGTQIPTEDDLLSWCSALNITKDERGNLLTLLHRAEAEYRNWKDNYRLAGGAAGKQRQILQFEKSAQLVREFQPSIIPGLIQTPGYAAELLRLPFGPTLFGATEADISSMVAIRLERQQILYDPTKKIQIIVLEGALATRVCSSKTLHEQICRLIDLFDLRTLRFGVVPYSAQLPLIPLGGYAVYDADVAILETLSGEQQLNSIGEITHYLSAFEALADVSLWGEQAVSVLKKAANSLKFG